MCRKHRKHAAIFRCCTLLRTRIYGQQGICTAQLYPRRLSNLTCMDVAQDAWKRLAFWLSASTIAPVEDLHNEAHTTHRQGQQSKLQSIQNAQAQGGAIGSGMLAKQPTPSNHLACGMMGETQGTLCYEGDGLISYCRSELASRHKAF